MLTQFDERSRLPVKAIFPFSSAIWSACENARLSVSPADKRLIERKQKVGSSNPEADLR